MDTTLDRDVVAPPTTRAGKAGMSERQWQDATRFDSTDWGWVIMSIGMAIGAGIVFLPVQVGLMGLWVFLLSSIVGYPAMYLFQRLFINTLAASKECTDYPGVIAGYLGKNWGMALGVLYFVMLVIWVFVYSTAITNDSASFIQSFGLTKDLLSHHWWYGLLLIIGLVALASRGEKLLFKVATGMVLTKLCVVAFLGLSMVPHWHASNVGTLPATGELIKQAVVMLPFTLTSILFIQSLSPMVISYRAKEQSIEVARFKAMRAMNIAFGILFVVVFFYAVSFTLAMGHEDAVRASQQNISALAMVAQTMTGHDAGSSVVKIMTLVLNIFAVMTAFFGVFLGFREACQGIAMNVLRRVVPEDRINTGLVAKGILVFAVLVSWGAIVLNAPVLSFTSICSPIFGLVGCLIPAYLVYKVPMLHKYKGVALYLIIATGILLCVSPFLAFS
ncbi:amino acid permease [Jeongeupia sp. USM3]|uniref:amino acid permease n=1 Tax=Jeongeupia sp. USM3 TaxID=1906741 RepID=UPI0009F29597|nr:amino acid permease [Jeongeupia sp. USM3]